MNGFYFVFPLVLTDVYKQFGQYPQKYQRVHFVYGAGYISHYGSGSRDVKWGSAVAKQAAGWPRDEANEKRGDCSNGAGAVRSKNWSVKKLFGERF